MSDRVVFEDYSVNVKDALRECAISFLHEVGGELRSRAERNSDPYRKTGQTADSYEYKVDEGQLAVHVGSNYENAIWEEFGTGVHALNGDGRKGWWVYVEGSSTSGSSKNGKSYSSASQAKKACAFLRSKGLNAHYTNGKKPRRILYKAFESFKSRIIARAKEVFGGLNS